MVSLELFVLTVPVLSGILLILWLGPKRWPVAARNAWETSVPESARVWILRIATQPLLWLLIGVFVGASMVNPLAAWLRSMLP
jgi:hypothetical protein